MSLDEHKKKNVDNLLRLRSQRYWGKPCYLKRVNAHAERRELSTSVLDNIHSIPQLSENKNQSGRFNVYVCLFSSGHRHLRF